MPVALALCGADLGVLLADYLGQLGRHHLVHDDEPSGRGECQQAVFDRPGHFGQGDCRLQRQVSQSGCLLRVRDVHNNYLFLHGGPLSGWFLDWSPETPTSRQGSGGGPPPHFNKLGDIVLAEPIPDEIVQR